MFVFPDGSVEVELSDEGDTVADMLVDVQLDPKTLLTHSRPVKQTDSGRCVAAAVPLRNFADRTVILILKMSTKYSACGAMHYLNRPFYIL